MEELSDGMHDGKVREKFVRGVAREGLGVV